jgi:hypothetical protein
MPDYKVPRELRARVKSMLGELRRARGLSVEQLASHPLVRIGAKKLQEYERPGASSPCPSKVLVAAIGHALVAPELVRLVQPDGWLVLSPEQVDLVRDALVAAGILPG